MSKRTPLGSATLLVWLPVGVVRVISARAASILASMRVQVRPVWLMSVIRVGRPVWSSRVTVRRVVRVAGSPGSARSSSCVSTVSRPSGVCVTSCEPWPTTAPSSSTRRYQLAAPGASCAESATAAAISSAGRRAGARAIARA